MKKRVLFIYEYLSIEELVPLRRLVEDKFEESVGYHTPLSEAEKFIAEAGVFDYVFFESSIDSQKVEALFQGSVVRIIKGLTEKEKEVSHFLSSL